MGEDRERVLHQKDTGSQNHPPDSNPTQILGSGERFTPKGFMPFIFSRT